MDLRNLPLASTPAGRTFAIKALHPADSEIKTVRGPGGCLPSVSIASDMVETIPFPAGASRAIILQTPNIAYPLTITFYNTNNEILANYLWSNAAIGGWGLQHGPLQDSDYAWMSNVPNMFQSHRVLAQSVTCEFIAPALANQGTILSAQFSFNPATLQPSWWILNAAGTEFESVTHACDLWAYPDPPTASQLIMGSSAYTSKAVDGFYQPLKIDKFKWVDTRDCFMPVRNNGAVQVARPGMYHKQSNFPIFSQDKDIKPTSYPYPKPNSKVVGITYVEGMATDYPISLRLRARQVCEVLPKAGSTYAPLAEAPYPPDELSYRMVREISARMKDAYPASYNDVGKLKETIAKIGSSVLKFADPVLDILSMVPGAGTVVGVARNAAKIGKALRSGINTLEKQKVNRSAPRAAQPSKKRQRKRGGRKKQNKDRRLVVVRRSAQEEVD